MMMMMMMMKGTVGGGGGGLVDGSLKAIVGILLLGFVALTEGNVHFVGGRDGWILSPSESYNHWTGNTRFQVNDTLVFSYKKGDSVLVVNETDYNTCNQNNPIQALHGGYSVFKLDQSGPFYFISGIPDQCYKGHKMVIVVMAVRNNTPNVTPATSPVPSISLPPTGSTLPPNTPLAPSPSVALAPGAGIAPAPISSGPSIGIAPALGPAGSGIGIAPASGPAGPITGSTPASAPNEPTPASGGPAIFVGMYWILLVLGFLILQVG